VTEDIGAITEMRAWNAQAHSRLFTYGTPQAQAVAACAKLKGLKFHPAINSNVLMMKLTSGRMKNLQRAFHPACATANVKAAPVIEYWITLLTNSQVR